MYGNKGDLLSAISDVPIDVAIEQIDSLFVGSAINYLDICAFIQGDGDCFAKLSESEHKLLPSVQGPDQVRGNLAAFAPSKWAR